MIRKYFSGSIFSAVLGLFLAWFIGYYYSQSLSGAIQAVFICAVLAILEVSLSFDNAIVNAAILKDMTPLWRHRFLTWGMIIAVFGMRLVFPIAIVSVLGSMSPWEALRLATFEPQQYADLMLRSHVQISAFGGAFLMMVCLKYFYNANKELHWIRAIEEPAALLGRVEAIELAITILFVIVLSHYIAPEDKLPYIVSALWGLFVFVMVDGISAFLEGENAGAGKDLEKASLGMFLYLEVLDASFSFDGVVGAFAITNNFYIIMIGLSIGAFFVRSLTIMFVEKNTLGTFDFLEHGAFYAIGLLASIMLLGPFVHIPEWVTGLSGAIVIGLSLIASIARAKQMQKS